MTDGYYLINALKTTLSLSYVLYANVIPEKISPLLFPFKNDLTCLGMFFKQYEV